MRSTLTSMAAIIAAMIGRKDLEAYRVGLHSSLEEVHSLLESSAAVSAADVKRLWFPARALVAYIENSGEGGLIASTPEGKTVQLRELDQEISSLVGC